MSTERMRDQVRQLISDPIAPAASRRTLHEALDQLPDGNIPVIHHVVRCLQAILHPLLDEQISGSDAAELRAVFRDLDEHAEFIAAAVDGSIMAYRSLTEWAERRLIEESFTVQRPASHLPKEGACYARLGLILVAAATGADPRVELAELIARLRGDHGKLSAIPRIVAQLVERVGRAHAPSESAFAQVLSEMQRIGYGSADLTAAISALWSEINPHRATPQGARFIQMLILSVLGVEPSNHRALIAACADAKAASELLATIFAANGVRKGPISANLVKSLSDALRLDDQYRAAAGVMLGLLGLEESQLTDATVARMTLETGFAHAELNDPLARANLVSSLSNALRLDDQYRAAAGVMLGLLGLEESQLTDATVARMTLETGFAHAELNDPLARANLVSSLSNALRMDGRYRAATGVMLGLLGLEESQLTDATVARMTLETGFAHAELNDPPTRAILVFSLSSALRMDGRYRSAAGVGLGLLGLDDTKLLDPAEALRTGFAHAELNDPLNRANLVISLSNALRMDGRYRAAAGVVLGLLGLDDTKLRDPAEALRTGFAHAELNDPPTHANLVISLSDALRLDGRYSTAAGVVLGLFGLDDTKLRDPAEALRTGFAHAELNNPPTRANLVSSLSEALRMDDRYRAAAGVVLGLLGLDDTKLRDPAKALRTGFAHAELNDPLTRANLVKSLSDALRMDGRHSAAAGVVLGLLGLDDTKLRDPAEALRTGFAHAELNDPLTRANLVKSLSEALRMDGRHSAAAGVVLGLLGLDDTKLRDPAEALRTGFAHAELNGPLTRANLVISLSEALHMDGRYRAAAGVVEAFVGRALAEIAAWPPPNSFIPMWNWFLLAESYIRSLRLCSRDSEALDVTERLRRWTIEKLRHDSEFTRWFDRQGAEEQMRLHGSILWRSGLHEGRVGLDEGVLHAEAFENLSVLSRLRRPRKQLRTEWIGRLALRETFEATANALPTIDSFDDDQVGIMAPGAVYSRLDEAPGASVFEPAEDHLQDAEPLLDFESTAERLIQTENLRGLLHENEILIRFFMEGGQGEGQGPGRVWWWIARPAGDRWEELGRAELAEGTTDRLRAIAKKFDRSVDDPLGTSPPLPALRRMFQEVESLLGLDGIDPAWLRERDVVIQADAEILNLPLAVARIGGGVRLCEVAASVTNVTSLSLRAIMTERAEQQQPAEPRLLSAVWLPEHQRAAFIGAIELNTNLEKRLPNWTVHAMSWSPMNLAATGTRLSAAISGGQYPVVLVTGHGHARHMTGAVQLGQTFPDENGKFDESNGRLWRADGTDFSAVELLVLCSCSVGRVQDRGHRGDLAGLYPDLAAKGARNVVLARYPVCDPGAPKLSTELIAEFARMRDGGDENRHFHAARALNSVRNLFLADGDPQSEWNASAFAIYA